MSRGLGDVYKRQFPCILSLFQQIDINDNKNKKFWCQGGGLFSTVVLVGSMRPDKQRKIIHHMWRRAMFLATEFCHKNGHRPEHQKFFETKNNPLYVA